MVQQPVTAPEYRFFAVTVQRVERLSPSFLRITLTGPELTGFGAAGADQRIKLVLSRDGAPVTDLLTDGPGWYADYCALPDDRRPYLRTYTVRAARPQLGELDVDVVLHGVEDGHPGPAASWAAAAVPGDPIVVLGPDRPGPGGAASGRPWGVEWAPPADGTLFLAGDETAVPAISAIVESLPAGRRTVAVLEVPEAGDVLSLTVPPGVEVRWLVRGGRARGEALGPAVHAALCELGVAARTAGQDPEDVDLEGGILWEVPERRPDGCYAWLAGEAGMVKKLRRRLVRDLGVPRTAVAFMGYWRLGAAEGS
ncbi:siderophore-interacting protein [Modestobacter sp. VKM Ac-2984]|uniref:siderophore-interacting protein n=1 Tax=Modestobacter sp. VKM Ac-2984 TaxID=3004138 RepID=UPI0022AA31F3|nr:siderophore-interacting protein [Modestobacter sp. VKM Ac-2984]MCZ2818590.1 siderophore-interacting protein [Modestobacter sp. VKM Ac-2984]